MTAKEVERLQRVLRLTKMIKGLGHVMLRTVCLVIYDLFLQNPSKYSKSIIWKA